MIIANIPPSFISPVLVQAFNDRSHISPKSNTANIPNRLGMRVPSLGTAVPKQSGMQVPGGREYSSCCVWLRPHHSYHPDCRVSVCVPGHPATPPCRHPIDALQSPFRMGIVVNSFVYYNENKYFCSQIKIRQ